MVSFSLSNVLYLILTVILGHIKCLVTFVCFRLPTVQFSKRKQFFFCNVVMDNEQGEQGEASVRQM